jgi:hypothetical protein
LPVEVAVTLVAQLQESLVGRRDALDESARSAAKNEIVELGQDVLPSGDQRATWLT